MIEILKEKHKHSCVRKASKMQFFSSRSTFTFVAGFRRRETLLHALDTHEFGKQFRHLVQTVDAKKRSKKAFLENTTEMRDYGRIQPFRGDHSRETARGWGYRIFFQNKKKRSYGDRSTRYTERRGSGLGSNWKSECDYTQKFITKCDFIGRIRKRSSTDKKVIFRRGNTSSATRCLKHFVKIWQSLTKDQKVLEILKGWEKPPLSNPFQILHRKGKVVSKKQSVMIDKEVSNRFCGVTRRSIFEHTTLVSKKYENQKPVKKPITSEPVCSISTYSKWRVNIASKNSWEKRIVWANWIWRTLTFVFRWTKNPGNFSDFIGQAIYTNSYACFGLGPAPRIFTKLCGSSLASENIREKCLSLQRNPRTTVLEPTKLLGHLNSRMQAILSARLQCIYLQREQIKAFRFRNSYTRIQ